MTKKRGKTIGRTARKVERRAAQTADDTAFCNQFLLAIPEGIQITRTRDGIILFANQAFESMFGYGRNELVGKHVSILNAPADRTPESTAREIMTRLKASGIWDGEIMNIRKDGTQFCSHATVTSLQHPQFGDVVIAVQRDIGERKRMEEALKSKNAALKEVLAQIETEKLEIRRQVSANVERVIMPIIKKLQNQARVEDKRYLDVLEASMRELTSRFGVKLSGGITILSGREMEICNMIKSGLSSKEMASLLKVSLKTVDTHRNRIRKKLGISGKDITLLSCLQSLG